MNIEKLKQLEANSEVKLKYLSAGTWGSNNIMYVPVILMVSAAMWILGWLFFLVKDMPLETTIIHLGVSLGVFLICFLWFRSIKKGILKKNKERINEFPVCLAKIVMGNDAQHLYYCIYTTGEKRLDEDWLNKIYYKIWNTKEEPNIQLRNKINSLFKPGMVATTSHESILLPLEFTDGEKVYKKFYGLQPDKLATVQNNDGFFPIICFNKISVPMIREEDYS